jgi:hypothetical protein
LLPHEETRRYALFGALASGACDRFKQFAEGCMTEYDLDGLDRAGSHQSRGVSVLQP